MTPISELLEEDGFACMTEMIIKLSRLPIRISEVPMVLDCNIRQGQSKMKRMKTILAYFRVIRKEVFVTKKRKSEILGLYKRNN